ncbi:DUF6473 family protein [Tropicimonas sp. IMCC6043]|uniref:DUF6473 family protein n=1 Tax=Tropicimonas sp. IMCC6043 TaxID=2510645 RepID=UPI0026908E31
MAFEHPGEGALDYLPCRYGSSRILFRGPRKALSDPYIAFLGGTETYGRFIVRPFPDVVGDALGVTGVNLGCVNGGIDVYLKDETLLGISGRAQVTVLQVMGAHNLSNRFYSVHPRRNDRFVGASPVMQALFREVDFTEFAFTRHLMSSLRSICPERFEHVVTELQTAWVARMRTLLQAIDGPKLLLWLADHRPENASAARAGYRNDPLYVERAMLNALEGLHDGCIEVVYDPEIRGTR